MADDEQTPQQRQSSPPQKQPDPKQAAKPRLTPLELDESARQRLRATVGKQYPTAPEEEIARSREKGGAHPDVPPTEALPPPTD